MEGNISIIFELPGIGHMSSALAVQQSTTRVLTLLRCTAITVHHLSHLHAWNGNGATPRQSHKNTPHHGTVKGGGGPRVPTFAAHTYICAVFPNSHLAKLFYNTTYG